MSIMEQNKRTISAKIVADSTDNRGNRITSYLLTYPRSIHAELMTHRMFSRNAASSRAIPLSKMIQSVKDDPFIPIAFQKSHSGMQGNKYIEHPDTLRIVKAAWLSGADSAIATAQAMDLCNVTKQICNRLIEPFLWYTVLVTATEYDNFFELRSPKYTFHTEDDEWIFKSKKDVINHFGEDEIVEDGFNKPIKELTELDWLKLSYSGAEIHIQALAEAMWDAMNESTPKQLEGGEWHIPFGDRMDSKALRREAEAWVNRFEEARKDNVLDNTMYTWDMKSLAQKAALKVGVARAARLSYMTFDGEIDYAKDIELHDRLFESKHMSPFEHVARCMTSEEYPICGKLTPRNIQVPHYFQEKLEGWCANFKGFIPYRFLIENDSI